MKWIIALLLMLPAQLAAANDWDALDQPGAMAIMRHALAPGTGDPTSFEIDDCSTQRNLNDRGRAQARAIGAAFRERGMDFDQVMTSQWCRSRETAELLNLGPVIEAPALNSFFRDFSTRDAQTAALRDLIANAGAPLMMVSHQVNISALTGEGTRSGEVIVFRLNGDEAKILGRIQIDP